MLEIEQTNFSIEIVVDLDGNDVDLGKMVVNQDHEMIPYKLDKKVPDEREYEGYLGNVSRPFKYPCLTSNRFCLS